MRILLTGCTGFIGQNLTEFLLKNGHDLIILSRNPEGLKATFDWPVEVYPWPGFGPVPVKALKGIEGVIHLAGEPVAKRRWDKKIKARIYDSRIRGTRDLITSLKDNSVMPTVFISASAVGYYGDRMDAELTEGDPVGAGFLAEVCRDWEDQVSQGFKNTLTRSVSIRIGMVLGLGGGALSELEPLARRGILGPLGDGKQWMSWIHIDDLLRIFDMALTHENLVGPVNGVAPQPERNSHFTEKLNESMGRWTMIPVPRFMVKLLKGDMAEMLLASQRCVPQKVKDFGFNFKHETLESAFRHLYPEPKSSFFVTKQWLPKSQEHLFPFFSDEKNLEKITPASLGLQVVGMSTDVIEEGTVIDYKLKVRGIPAKWRSRISEWDPNKRFVDEQIKGPYRRWHHTHKFEPLKGGTLCTDEVRYQLPMGILGELTAGSLVRSDIGQIFSHRRKILRELFKN